MGMMRGKVSHVGWQMRTFKMNYFAKVKRSFLQRENGRKQHLYEKTQGKIVRSRKFKIF
jgi:hypothetical protein